MQTFFPTSLLRSLQQFAVSEKVNDTVDSFHDATLNQGAMLGTTRFAQTSEDDVTATQQVAVWGLVCRAFEDINNQSFDSNLPEGIHRIGSFVVVRKDTFDSHKELGTTWYLIAH